MDDKLNVLIVDDNEDLLSTLSLIFHRRGFNVVTAEDGFSAVTKFKSNQFDVILMDVRMPEINGLEALHMIKEIDSGSIIILMTASEHDELIDEALNKSAYKVINKPIKIDQTLEMIREAAQVKKNCRKN